jgi:hypothetical protein
MPLWDDWSFSKQRYVSELEELFEDNERTQARRRRAFWARVLSILTCCIYDPTTAQIEEY